MVPLQASAPVVTDGPYPESRELLAARASAAPGPGGTPIRQPSEVR